MRTPAISRICLLVATILAGCSSTHTTGPAAGPATLIASPTNPPLIASPVLANWRTPTRLPPATPTLISLSSLPPGQCLLVADYWPDYSGRYHWSVRALYPDGQDLGPIRFGDGTPLAFSPSGTSLVAVDPDRSQARHSDLYVSDLVTGQVTDVPGDPLHEPYELTWSPDESTLTVDRQGDLYLLDLSTGEIALALDCHAVDLGSCCCPAWSPDRLHLALQFELARSGPADSRNGLYLLEGACFLSPHACPFEEWHRVPDPRGPAAWSPDGSQIAVADNSALFLVDAATLSTTRQIPFGPEANFVALEWSPDEENIAIATRYALHLLSLVRPSDPVPLYNARGQIGPVTWLLVSH